MPADTPITAQPEADALPSPSATVVATSRNLPEEKSPQIGTVRVASEKLDAVFLQAEELLSAKLLSEQRLRDLSEIQAQVASRSKSWTNIRTRHPDFYSATASQPQWLEHLEQNTVFLKDLTYQLDAMEKSARQDQRLLGKMVDDLLEGMKHILMLPFSTLMEILPRLVSDLASDSGKEIDLEIHGAELEADRRILEEFKAPLIHLLRNCVDHGIEKPEQRRLRDKPARGNIDITIAPRSGNRVEIKISDDGVGIDIAKLKATAERLGLLDQDTASRLDEHAALALMYQSGISTSPIITEVSGRGLGLAIVREKADKLGGDVRVETRPGAGTTFRIVLPLTLTTYRGIIVRLDDQLFVLPITNVEQSIRVHEDVVQTVENRPTIRLEQATLSMVWLGDLLGVPCRQKAETGLYQVVVLTATGMRIAFVVDEVLGEQEVLVKSLGRQLSRVRNVAAATILGSGKAVPILNVTDLMKSAQLAPAGKARLTTAADTEKTGEESSVLVVEDSITARSLIKGILELAGYRVSTAVDGIDGWTQLRSKKFDLVVSDVDMPRMNGFELTKKIRGDKQQADLPVVLVTALESREDREHGIEVGANAYIVKRSFEQSNLLEVVRRLI
ncbi:MAG: response regulator [Methylomonas sp.]|uniref:hybrid sensor histidine kinase/response regulator n=1 Tax=Methylomonas sp. TaxID=418 RepID=UPI0025D68871|nr:response regulator [Methylomonas sp.]MCK9607483.1 response regulator [Methylomonas sp.]